MSDGCPLPECHFLFSDDYARRAAENKASLDTFKRELFKQLIAMGHTVTNLFLSAQGHGDMGATDTTDEGTVLHRSETPQVRSFRTVFGKHSVTSFVYSRAVRQKIELRPIDAKLNLPYRLASYSRNCSALRRRSASGRNSSKRSSAAGSSQRFASFRPLTRSRYSPPTNGYIGKQQSG